VEAFPDERGAFRAFAQDFPGRTTFLVDTYDTPNGVRTAVDVIRQLGLRGPLGVRIDSGDLNELSRDARGILDEADLRDVRIFASGGLDEHAIESLVASGAPIDAFGVGTQLANAPTLESVYKLVRYGDRPALKLSTGKATLPGEKQVFRTGEGDALGLRGEAGPAGSTPLLADVMRSGRRVGISNGLDAVRQRFDADIAWLPDAARRLTDPTMPEPRVTDALAGLRDRSTADALAYLGLRGR
jgi:nicotinate phosphoribosyltransferase